MEEDLHHIMDCKFSCFSLIIIAWPIPILLSLLSLHMNIMLVSCS
jgi:hypothetical protein